MAASGLDSDNHIQARVRPAVPKLAHPMLKGRNGDPLTPLLKRKKQLRPVVNDWLLRTYDLGTKIAEKWTPEVTAGLDPDPSNRIWRRRGDIPTARMAQVL